MAGKRKISIRKILQLLLTIVVTSCCIIAMVGASRIEGNKVLKNVVIHYNNCKKYHSVEEKEIMDLAINNRNIDIQHTPLSKLDIHSMEQLIMANPWIANAQVFIDNERVLHMYVTQRIPIVRVFQQDGSSFYLDTTMSVIPLSSNYIYYTMVVTNVPYLKNDSISWALRKDIISLVKNIQADSFWAAQISHVVVDSAGMYELVPILGDHRILFGDASLMKEKFSNLFAFYKNVLNRIGWDKYQTLDVRFKEQVVAAPSLPYSGPVDKAVTNMNWINSIVETEARNDAKDSVQVTENKPKQIADAKKKPPVKPPPKHAQAKKQTPKTIAKKNEKPPQRKNVKAQQKIKARKSEVKNKHQ